TLNVPGRNSWGRFASKKHNNHAHQTHDGQSRERDQKVAAHGEECRRGAVESSSAGGLGALRQDCLLHASPGSFGRHSARHTFTNATTATGTSGFSLLRCLQTGADSARCGNETGCALLAKRRVELIAKALSDLAKRVE